MGEFIIFFLIAIGFAIVYFFIDTSIRNKHISKSNDCWSFDENTKVLTVYKQHPSLGKLFYCQEYVSKQTRYMKEEYVFTAARSGNVTVGGVDKIGGYKEEKIKTDKYNLSFTYGDAKTANIKKIILSEDLLKKAQNSPIKKYIKDNYIEIVLKKIEPNPITLSKASVTVRSTLEEQAIIDTLPSKLKCDEIIKWLSDAPKDKALRNDEKYNEENYKQGIQAFRKKEYSLAKTYFENCTEWKNSSEYINKCEHALKNPDKIKSKNIIRVLISVIVIISVVVGYKYNINSKYEKALSLINSGDYDNGYTILQELGKNDIIVQNKYERGLQYISNEQYDEAFELLSQITEYRDVSTELERIKLKNPKKGDIISFGNYNNNQLEWKVLARENNKVFLFCRYSVDCVYGYELGDGIEIRNNTDDWASCTMRKWLNEDFYREAFTNTEQEAIIETKHFTEIDYSELGTGYSRTPVVLTSEKIFLLSNSEFYSYISYKDLNEINTLMYEKYGSYNIWTRSIASDYLYWVDANRNVWPEHSMKYKANIVPAMWVDISKL